MAIKYISLFPDQDSFIKHYFPEFEFEDIDNAEIEALLTSPPGYVCWVSSEPSRIMETEIGKQFCTEHALIVDGVKDLRIMLGVDPDVEHWTVIEDSVGALRGMKAGQVLYLTEHQSEAVELTKRTAYNAIWTDILDDYLETCYDNEEDEDFAAESVVISPTRLLGSELEYIKGYVVDEVINEAEVVDIESEDDFDYVKHYTETYGYVFHNALLEVEQMLNNVNQTAAVQITDVFSDDPAPFTDRVGDTEVRNFARYLESPIQVFAWITPIMFEKLDTETVISILTEGATNGKAYEIIDGSERTADESDKRIQ